jgi:hypothetical protein
MGKDDQSKSYSYTYSKDYSLLTAPNPPGSPPTNIPIPPSIPNQPVSDFSESDNTIKDGTLQANPQLNSSSIIIIIAVSITITILFVLFMIYMFFLRKPS